MNFFKLKWNIRKLRKQVKGVCCDADKLIKMRGDLLPVETIASLTLSQNELKQEAKKLHFWNKIKPQEKLDKIAASVKSLSSTVDELTPPSLKHPMYAILDTLLVAFGVAMAFRAYFFQPFKIPTGSMQPTLFGVHSEYVEDPTMATFCDTTPVFKQLKWLITGASYVDVVADKKCIATLEVDPSSPGFLIISMDDKKYKIPQDAFSRCEVKGFCNKDSTGKDKFDNRIIVNKGERLWSGYVHSGDQVFANRMAWNFFPPDRDDTMIFTTSVPEIELCMPSTKSNTFPFPFIVKDESYYNDEDLPPGQHYIKRLVGKPNEAISIADGRIVVNGEPVVGLPGMEKITTGENGYKPYRLVSESNPDNVVNGLVLSNNGKLTKGFLVNPGDTVQLGDEYMALGDNTSSSKDSRFWGPVPRKAMVGPAAIVWWPFTERWGRVK